MTRIAVGATLVLAFSYGEVVGGLVLIAVYVLHLWDEVQAEFQDTTQDGG